RVRKRLSLMTYTYVVYGISSMTLVNYNFILQNSFFGFSSHSWCICLALTVFPPYFGHTLFICTLKYVSTATISLAVLFEPIGASILAYFILGVRVTSSQWLGGSIVIIGLFLFIMGTRRKRDVTIARKNDNTR